MKMAVLYTAAPALLLAGAGIQALISQNNEDTDALIEERDSLHAQLEEAQRQTKEANDRKLVSDENLANAGIQVSALEKRARVAESRIAEVEAARSKATGNRDETLSDLNDAVEVAKVLNGEVDRLNKENQKLSKEVAEARRLLLGLQSELDILEEYRGIKFSGKPVKDPVAARTLITRLQELEKKKPLDNPRVLNVDPKYGFVQVNLGRDHAEVGDKLRVRRSGQLVGLITVLRVTDMHAFCQIDKANTVGTPREGDSIERTN